MSDLSHETDKEQVAVFQATTPDGDEVTVHEGPPGCAAGQIRGEREEQQDCYGWLLEDQGEGAGEELLLILADGMGGHAGGAVASRTVVEAFGTPSASYVPSVSERLDDSLDGANRAVARTIREDPNIYDMGSTLVGAHIAGGRRLRWISVGDSPMWRLANGRLVRLNKDHSMKPVLAQLVEMGYMSAEEAAADRRNHELRSVVMGLNIPHIDLQDEAVELATGDILIIASDGLETLDDASIAQVLESNRGSATAMVKALLTAVQQKEKPHQDNATVMVFIPELARGEAGSDDERGSQQAE